MVNSQEMSDDLLVIDKVGVEEDADAQVKHWITLGEELEINEDHLLAVIEHDVVAPEIYMNQ